MIKRYFRPADTSTPAPSRAAAAPLAGRIRRGRLPPTKRTFVNCHISSARAFLRGSPSVIFYYPPTHTTPSAPGVYYFLVFSLVFFFYLVPRAVRYYRHRVYIYIYMFIRREYTFSRGLGPRCGFFFTSFFFLFCFFLPSLISRPLSVPREPEPVVASKTTPFAFRLARDIIGDGPGTGYRRDRDVAGNDAF